MFWIVMVFLVCSGRRSRAPYPFERSSGSHGTNGDPPRLRIDGEVRGVDAQVLQVGRRLQF